MPLIARSARWPYAVTALIVFAVEVAIALRLVGRPGTPFASFIRGSVGDVLAVALVYCVLRACTGLSMRMACVAAIAVGFIVEALQYFYIAELLGLAKGSVLYVLIGSTFSAMDLLMYAVGGLLAWLLDHLCHRRRTAQAT